MKRLVVKGSNVYTENPQRLIPDCVSITGDVTEVISRPDGKWVTVDAYVAKMGGGYPIQVCLRIEEVGVRIGTPVSKISTRPGTPGYAEWCRISRSWGQF